jgi:predicted DNA-binding ArsR family transcriptional regulator
MTRKHWITKKEIKELYGLSDNKIALMRKLNLVSTKVGTNEGKGRKPLLYKKSMVNLVKDLTPIQLNELGNVVEDTREQFENQFNKSDIDAVVEEDCKKYEYTYVQSVNHPSHYNKTQLEVIDAIDIWGLDFSEGNVVKYLLRAKHKNNAREDLEKALWYVQRLLDNL